MAMIKVRLIVTEGGRNAQVCLSKREEANRSENAHYYNLFLYLISRIKICVISQGATQ
jgi:hypothetical protein